MNSAPRISLVTPSFNQAEYIRATIESVLDQRYPNLEFIVLDGGSTDGSTKIIESFAKHLTYWRSRPDGGQAAALKEGFEMATGEIYSWLNSDDLLCDGALGSVAEAWNTHGPEVMIAGGCVMLDGDVRAGTHYPRFQKAFNTPDRIRMESLLDMPRHWFPGEYFYQPEVFFPATAYHRAGGVDPSIHLTMDYDLWVRIANLQTPIVVLDRPIAQYREHEQQKTASKDPLYRDMIETANRYLASGDIDLSRRTITMLRWMNLAARSSLFRGTWKLAARSTLW